MKNLADYIASEMNSRIESEEHKSIFGSDSLSKFAAKKDEDEEKEEKDEKDEKKKDKKDKEESKKSEASKKENPFAKKDDDDDDDKKDDDKSDKKDEKKEDDKEDKKDKKEALLEIFDGIERFSSTLDSLGLTKSSIDMIRTIESIVAEAAGPDCSYGDDKKDEDEDEDEEKEDEKDEKDEKKDKKDDKSDEDKNDSDDPAVTSAIAEALDEFERSLSSEEAEAVREE